MHRLAKRNVGHRVERVEQAINLGRDRDSLIIGRNWHAGQFKRIAALRRRQRLDRAGELASIHDVAR